jgi:hypothetical protein
MMIPNELGCALGGLVLGWLSRQLRLPFPGAARRSDDMRDAIRAVLRDLLQPPAPAAARVTDEELRQKLREFVRKSGNDDRTNVTAPVRDNP